MSRRPPGSTRTDTLFPARPFFRSIFATEAASEVGPALFFSLLLITLSFIPVFTLEAQEGRLFAPLAIIGVLVGPGQTMLSSTPFEASSRATDLVKLMRQIGRAHV